MTTTGAGAEATGSSRRRPRGRSASSRMRRISSERLAVSSRIEAICCSRSRTSSVRAMASSRARFSDSWLSLSRRLASLIFPTSGSQFLATTLLVLGPALRFLAGRRRLRPGALQALADLLELASELVAGKKGEQSGESEDCRDHESDCVHLTLRRPWARCLSTSHAAPPEGRKPHGEAFAPREIARRCIRSSADQRWRITKISALALASPWSLFVPPVTRMRPSPRFVQAA